MSASTSQAELRLVVLGQRTAARRPAVCSVLDLEQNPAGPDVADVQGCTKRRGEAAGRQVVVVSSPAWFSSACSQQERTKHISSLITASSPGPHALLLCVPLNQAADGEARALDALEKLLGPSAVSRNTIILFTHTEELEEDEKLEEYLITWRKDLRELVGRCGDRYHTLETRNGGAEEKRAVEELLEKVEQVVKESGGQHFSCPLYQEVEERVRERQVELASGKRGGEQASGAQLSEEEMEAVREEAEESVGELHMDLDGIFSSAAVSASSAARSGLGGLWEKLVAWIRWLPTLVRREALLGALVGLFVGGPAGGMVGATVGSVATEMGRRKTQKNE